MENVLVGGKASEYFMGLDIGTNSVGWAVTNPQYELLKCKGHKMWGSRLFEEGRTAVERRTFRSARRRLARRKARLNLLEELFAEEIAKVDATFFLRLKESKYHFEDKTTGQKDVLFADSTYTDQNFYETYPTIYHLRNTLMTKGTKDIRELFLALHHIMKYRGNFLYEGQSFNANSAINEVLRSALSQLELLPTTEKFSVESLVEILLDMSKTKSDRSKAFVEFYTSDTKIKKRATAFSKLVLGLKANLVDLLCEEGEEHDSDKNYLELEFAGKDFSEVQPEYANAWGEKIEILDNCKSIYDAILLSNIVKDGKTLSQSKIEIYEQHKDELVELKGLLKSNRKVYNRVLKADEKGLNNYVKYIKQGKEDKTSCSKADFYKFLKSELSNLPDSPMKAEILRKIDIEQYLPLQRITDNGVIPYQLHFNELTAILTKAEENFAFLRNVSDGLTVSDKIKAMFQFRIPYYIGPLNTSHADKGHAWAVRKAPGKIYPWNLSEKIDEAASAEKFIRKMTNKCTYLVGEDVLPKESLLYSYFMLLNEINNIRYDNQPLSYEVKLAFINTIFKNKNGHKRVTKKLIKEFLKSEGLITGAGEISGIDADIKADLKSYRDMERILGSGFDADMAETIILWVTLFGESKKMLVNKLRDTYGDKLSDNQIKSIKRLKYKDWGRLSKEFLLNLEGIEKSEDSQDDMPVSIMYRLEYTTENLMQLLSAKYSYLEAIEEFNKDRMAPVGSDTYALVEELAVSPGVKRSVWQALKLVKEVTQLRGSVPSKIFVEVARTNRAEKTRKASRKTRFLELYKAIKNESREWKTEIEQFSENQFRSKKLFLYYTQMGRCMYSGDLISLDELFTDAYDIDHIFPRSMTKDDSFDNTVLVKAKLNRDKSDVYPIYDNIRAKMAPIWKMLLDHDLISKRKYERLIRHTELTADELSSFIARQIVETNQSVKATTQLLKRIYPDTEIVYVKAENVSDFRHDNDFVKVRSLNNHHHAKDAYLNIVVGNVYSEKFTKNPYNFIQKNGSRRVYNLAKMFDNDILVKRANGKEVLIWNKERDMSIITKMMSSNDVRVTRKLVEQKGALYDATVYKAGVAKPESYVAMQPNDSKLGDVTKYGGYTKIKNAYFVIYSRESMNGKSEICVIALPVNCIGQLHDISSLERYIGKQSTKFKNIKILCKKLCINSLIKIDGFYYYVGGKTNDRFYIDSAVQVVLRPESIRYLKYIENFMGRLSDNSDLKPNESLISFEKNIELFMEFVEKFNSNIYKHMKGNKFEELNTIAVEHFKNLDLTEQCKQIMQVLNLLTHAKTTYDIKALGIKASRLLQGFNLTSLKEFIIINQSCTGLYENEIPIIGG